MASKKVKGTKLGLGAFQKSTGGADDAAIPTAPRGEQTASLGSSRGGQLSDNWKTDRESFQTGRGGRPRGGGGGGAGGFGGRSRFSEEDGGGGDDAGSRADSASEWRRSGPSSSAPRSFGGGAGRGGRSRYGDEDSGSSQPFVAGRPRGKYAEGLDGQSSSQAWRPSRGGFGGGAGRGRRDDEDAGNDRGGSAWRRGNEDTGAAPARRTFGGGFNRGPTRDDDAGARPAHLRLKDRLKKTGDEDEPKSDDKPTPKKAAAPAAGDDEEDDEPQPPSKPVKRAPAAAADDEEEPAEEDNGEGETEAAPEEEEEDDDDDDDKPTSVWASNIKAQKKAAKAAAAAPAAAPKTGAYRRTAPPAGAVDDEEDVTPAEALRRQREADAAVAAAKKTAPAPARKPVAALRPAPAAVAVGATNDLPNKPAAKKPSLFGDARPVTTRDNEGASLAPMKLRGPRSAAAAAPADRDRPRQPEIRGRYMADEDDDEPVVEGEDDEEEPAPKATKGKATAPAAAEKKVVRDLKVDSKIEKQKFVSAKDSRSALDIAIRDETTVDDKQLAEGLARLSLKKGDADAVARLADVIAKSVLEKKLSLADAVVAAQENKIEASSATVITAVVANIKKRKGELVLSELADAAKEHDVDVFAAVTADLKQNDSKAVDAYLNERGIMCLKPVADCTAEVVAALNAGKSANAVLEIIKAKVGAVPVPNVVVPLAEHIAKKAGAADGKDAKATAEALGPVVVRAVGERPLQVVFLNKLMTLVARPAVKPLWTALKAANALPSEAFLAWQSDDPYKGRDKKNPLTADEKKNRAHKQDAIIATNSWLEEVAEEVRKLNEPEPDEGEEGEDGEGEGDEEDGDEYLQNANY